MSSESPPKIKPSQSLARKISRQDDAIIEATWAYYHDGLNQNAIANRLGVSRASVVNYLTEARRRDYVRITLDSEIFLNNDLAGQLKDAYGLEEVLVIPSDPTGEVRSAERVARATADWLPQLLEPGDQLGIAWGETLYRVAEAVPHLTIEDVTVVQLAGSRRAKVGFAAEVCSSTIARHFGAKCINLHAPLVLSDSDLATRFKAEPDIADQLEAVANCNKVLFACGTVDDNSHVARIKIHSQEELDALRAKGAAGVICAHFVDKQGNHLPTSIDDRMIGVTLEQMRNKQMGLLITSGHDRVEGAHAALLGGYTTHLATCSNTANQLMEYFK